MVRGRTALLLMSLFTAVLLYGNGLRLDTTESNRRMIDFAALFITVQQIYWVYLHNIKERGKI